MHSEGGSAPGDQGDIGAVVRRQQRRSVRLCILHIIEQKSVRKMHKGVEFCILVSKQGCIYVSNDWLALLLLYSYSRQECTLERFPAVAKILLSLPTSSPSFFFHQLSASVASSIQVYNWETVHHRCQDDERQQEIVRKPWGDFCDSAYASPSAPLDPEYQMKQPQDDVEHRADMLNLVSSVNVCISNSY